LSPGAAAGAGQVRQHGSDHRQEVMVAGDLI